MQIRQINSLSVAAKGAHSDRVCYVIVPSLEGMGFLDHIEKTAGIYGCSIAVISVSNWNDDLTPWPAPGVFRAKEPFGGMAEVFLDTFLGCIWEIEDSMGLVSPKRYLIGVSLSGLFAVWTLSKTDIFCGIGSISGSLWYDSFVEWLEKAEMRNPSVKVFMCLGDRERFSKDNRISQVKTLTESAVRILESKNIEISFQLVEGTHFSPLEPRIDLAFKKLLQTK